jgi:flagellar motor protein MotB
MKVRHTIIAVFALALLAAPLAGCRSSKKRATTAALPAGQASSTAVWTTPRPAPPSSIPPAPTTMPPAPAWAGTPDEPAPMDPLAGLPEPAPAPVLAPAPTPAVAPTPAPDPRASVIVADREARQRLEQKIAALQRSLREADQDLTAPAPVAAEPTPMPGSSTLQAKRFASAIRNRTAGEVEVNGDLVIIRFSDAFQPGSEKLKADAGLKATLLAAADELTRLPGARIEVVGHSDSTKLVKTKARWGTNENLSRERAQTVATQLSRHGVAAGRMVVSGRGSVEPLVFPEKSAADRARNRRVEIHVRF